jgi:hypothetical protein
MNAVQEEELSFESLDFNICYFYIFTLNLNCSFKVIRFILIRKFKNFNEFNRYFVRIFILA